MTVELKQINTKSVNRQSVTHSSESSSSSPRMVGQVSKLLEKLPTKLKRENSSTK